MMHAPPTHTPASRQVAPSALVSHAMKSSSVAHTYPWTSAGASRLAIATHRVSVGQVSWFGHTVASDDAHAAIAISAPTLARELQMVGAEVAAGVPRAEAMRHLAERTGVDEVLSLVNVLVQAERFGTSVAKALRVHSEHVRTRRMQRAEEKAAQVSPKLTIIMILFILPCLMMVLMGPALIRVKNLFATRNASHGSP